MPGATLEDLKQVLIISCYDFLVVCEALGKPNHGSVSISGREPGSRATYRCSHPYLLQGGRTRVCGPNGKWEGKMPSCRGKEEMLGYQLKN